MNSWIHSHVILVLSIVVLDQHVNMILATNSSRISLHPTHPSPVRNGTILQRLPSGYSTSSSSVSNFSSSRPSFNHNASAHLSISFSVSLAPSSNLSPLSTFSSPSPSPSSMSFNSSHFSTSIPSSFSSLSALNQSSFPYTSFTSSLPPDTMFSVSINLAPSSPKNKSLSYVKSPSLSSPSSITISYSYPSSSLSVLTSQVVPSFSSLLTTYSFLSTSSHSISLNKSNTSQVVPSFPSSITTSTFLSTSSQPISPDNPNTSQVVPSFPSSTTTSTFLSTSSQFISPDDPDALRSSSLLPSYPSSLPSSFTKQSTTEKASLPLLTTFSNRSFSQTLRSRTSHSTLDTASQQMKSLSLVISKIKTSYSSFMTTETSSGRNNTSAVLANLLEFNGKLIVSLKNPATLNKGLKYVSESIERVLDDIFTDVPGFVYSKVLQITRNKEGRLECLFKLFIKEPSDATPDTLEGRLNSSAQSFGEFTLHYASIAPEDKDGDELKLWTIIVIAVLGALCLLLAIVFVYQWKRIKKLKRKQNITPSQNAKDNKRYQPYLVFDGMDETQNIPLKMMKIPVSPTDSKKPLKSDSSGSEGEDERSLGHEDETRKVTDQPSSSELDVENDQTCDKELDVADKLQINEVQAEDENKFSTFTRKR